MQKTKENWKEEIREIYKGIKCDACGIEKCFMVSIINKISTLILKEKESFVLELENMLDDGKPLGPLVKELIIKYKHD